MDTDQGTKGGGPEEEVVIIREGEGEVSHKEEDPITKSKDQPISPASPPTPTLDLNDPPPHGTHHNPIPATDIPTTRKPKLKPHLPPLTNNNVPATDRVMGSRRERPATRH